MHLTPSNNAFENGRAKKRRAAQRERQIAALMGRKKSYEHY
jgi:hypothetical protein